VVLFFGSGINGAATRFKDRGANSALVQAYNNHLVHYCSAAPDRLIGMVMLPTSGVDDAIAEMERCRALGLDSVCLSMWPNGSDGPVPEEDDRFWAACLASGTHVVGHFTWGAWDWPTNPIMVPPEQAVGGQRGVGQGRCGVTISQLIGQGTFDRFPDLRIYLAETQAGWLAPHLDLMDEFYQRWYTYYDIKLSKQPSQYYRDHLLFSFIYDRMAMRLREYIGVDILMWGSDFPHSVGTFPDSREILPDLFEGVPEDEKRKVLVTNATDFFGLDPDKELTPTP
jgi:predicted TIM-barrel fold metal-dependent hydrolase